jgi:ribonucleoside-diphosphate reductase alpha chain
VNSIQKNKNYLLFEFLVQKEERPSSEEILTILSSDLKSIDISLLSKYFSVIDKIIKDEEFFSELAILCRDKSYAHFEWSHLAGRIRMIYIKRTAPKTFEESVKLMKPLLSEDYYNFCIANSKKLETIINPKFDWNFDIFGTETLLRGYLAKVKDKFSISRIAETPQYLYLRVAIFLWHPALCAERQYLENNKDQIEELFNVIKITYKDLSKGKISAPSPLQFNAGMIRPQCASCFLIGIEDDLRSIKKSWGDSALISKESGGLGICFDALRHSEIGNHGWSKGVVPWIKIENEILHTCDQCFHPDTIIYTINNGPKFISEVCPGDLLIKADGSSNKVLQPIIYDVKLEDQYYKLSIKYYTKPVIVSKSHPFLCINKQIKGITSHKDILNKLYTGKAIPEYTSVEDIEIGSFIGIPIPSYEADLPRYSNDDCRMYGILLGDGHLTKDKNEAGVHFGEVAKSDTVKFVRNYLTLNGLHFWESIEKNTISIRWSRKHHLFPFTRNMLYDEKDNKYFYPGFLHLPMEKIENIFIGIMETDGCYKKDSGEITLELSSPQVIESIRYILLRMGVTTSGYCRDRRGNVSHLKRGDTIITRKCTEVLRIPKTFRICELLNKTDPVQSTCFMRSVKGVSRCAEHTFCSLRDASVVHFFEYNKKLWSRVNGKELIQEPNFNTVMDLEMEYCENPEITSNYMTCIGIAHNGGRRSGSGTMFITDWHPDIFEFIDLKLPVGKPELRAQDLFYGIMISDLFMKRVKNDEMWSLICPAKTNKLYTKYGSEFEKEYLKIEEDSLKGNAPSSFKQIKARELWLHILNSQIKTGMPFIVYKDSVNRKSNQKNIGTIRTSNLCVEIMEYVDSDNIASCTLSSIPVSKFVKCNDPNKSLPYFDFEELGLVTRRAVRNLAQVINRTYYQPDIAQIKYCNMRNRPIGIGLQDLAGCFALMDITWNSDEATVLNEKIARVMYYNGIDESVKMSQELGSYETFSGSPASKGLFQFDLWTIEELEKKNNNEFFVINDKDLKVPCNEFDWNDLRKRMIRHGLYFSLMFAQMPTASSAQILCNNESVEPYTQLLYARTVLSGQFVVSVKHLVRDLEKIWLWNDQMLKHLFLNQGSIQTFPEDNLEGYILFRLRYLKEKYKTSFELSQRRLADLYFARARYQCQSSSNNVFIKNPTTSILNAYHFYMWNGGAKTGMYYLRQTSGAEPLNFSLDSLHVSTRESRSVKDATEKSNGEEKLVSNIIECLSCNS